VRGPAASAVRTVVELEQEQDVFVVPATANVAAHWGKIRSGLVPPGKNVRVLGSRSSASSSRQPTEPVTT